MITSRPVCKATDSGLTSNVSDVRLFRLLASMDPRDFGGAAFLGRRLASNESSLLWANFGIPATQLL